MLVPQHDRSSAIALISKDPFLWKNPALLPIPYNAVTKEHFSGINILLLWASSHSSPAWLTVRQVELLGGCVRGGEEPTRIAMFTRPRSRRLGPRARRNSGSRWASVVNITQCEGLPISVTEPRETVRRTFADLARFIKRVGARLLHDAESPYYVLGDDTIHLPHLRVYKCPSEYFTASLHEHTHWTGHMSRLNRYTLGADDDRLIAIEEFIAELGAVLVSTHLGIDEDMWHERYIERHCHILKDDPTAIIPVAARASEAAAYLIGRALV